MMVYAEPFLTAEIDYRRQRAAQQYGRAAGKPAGGRRHWVPRRPSLKLPQVRRRPLSVA